MGELLILVANIRALRVSFVLFVVIKSCLGPNSLAHQESTLSNIDTPRDVRCSRLFVE